MPGAMTETAATSNTRVLLGPPARGKVLVLGRDNAIFLSVVRSLGRRGLEVHVGWFPEHCATLESRYVTKAHHLPAATPGGRWLPALVELLTRERFELVIPVSEQAVHPLQRHRRELEGLSRLALLDDEVYAVVFDKARTYALAEGCGLRLPRQLAISSPSDLGRLTSELSFPLVLKPRSSYAPDAPGRRRDVAKAFDRAELERLLPGLLEECGEILVQENFLGHGTGVEVIADRGDVLFAFQHRRVHEPLHGGGSSYRVSTALDPELLQASERLMRALRYTGVAMIEFKVDPATNAWVFLEINGRFWGSLPLAIASGADFPYWLYELLADGRRDFPQRYRRGVYSRNLVGDLAWMASNLRADRTDPTLSTRPLSAVALELVHAATLQERIDTLTLDDPRPAVAEVRHYVLRSANKLFDRARARIAALHLPRRREAARAKRAIVPGARVLFVCKGNICRSPFAERIARRLRPDLAVDSAGFIPEEDRPSPAEAARAAEERGISLGDHRSRRITAAMVRDAGAIFVFDEENLRDVRRAFPWARWKTFRLGALDGPGGPIEVEDPFGEGIDAFRACYRRIEKLCEAALGGGRT